MIDAMISLTWASMMASHMLPDQDKVNNTAPDRGDDLLFETSDGYITAVAVSEIEWQGLCRALDREEWLDNERLNTPAGRTTNTDALSELLSPIVQAKPSKYWLDLFDQHGVPCGPVLSPAEIPHDEQIIANELVDVLDHPGIGRVRQSRPAARFSGTPAHIQGPAPKIGEHTRTILDRFSFSEAEIADLYSQNVVR
jgi:crotonobetainyl-CoA:carnitine CoA-transferase CaiB-like acyl-CoA transferase